MTVCWMSCTETNTKGVIDEIREIVAVKLSRVREKRWGQLE